MKVLNSILFLLTLLCSQISSGQSVEWISPLVDCMYKGYDNVLPLKFIDVKQEDVLVEVSAGTLNTDENGRYIWKDAPIGGPHTISCTYKGETIGQFKLPFKRFPDPVITSVPKAATLNNISGIKASLPGVNIKIPIYVGDFEVHVTVNDELSVYPQKGTQFNAQLKNILKRLDSSASVRIENLRIKCPGDVATRNVGGIVLQ